jgi:hypothetical protein
MKAGSGAKRRTEESFQAVEEYVFVFLSCMKPILKL